jgi:hypothetical protein
VDAEKSVREKWRLLQPTMDERARWLWAGTEAGAIGYGGVATAARATGTAISTGRQSGVHRGARGRDLMLRIGVMVLRRTGAAQHQASFFVRDR